jgi:hypothetical protein
MTRREQFRLARFGLMTSVAYTSWMEWPERKTNVELMQRTADLCQQLTLFMLQYSVPQPLRDKIEHVGHLAEIVSLLANTSTDSTLVALFKRPHHKLGMSPDRVPEAAKPLTRNNMPGDLGKALELLDSCCAESSMHLRSAWTVLESAATVAATLAAEIYRLTPNESPCKQYMRELSIMAQALPVSIREPLMDTRA